VFYALRNLGKGKPRIEHRCQLFPILRTLNPALNLDGLSIGSNDPVLVQKHLPMLAHGIERWQGSHWHSRLACDVLYVLQYLAHRDITWILFCRVIRASEKDREDIRSRNVLSEYAIEHRVALGLIIERRMDARTTVGSKAQNAWHSRGVRRWGNLHYRIEMETERGLYSGSFAH